MPPLALTDWQWLEVQSGLAWVQQATREQFVPQMLNLELLGGVNFQKGCYPGQEVVARSQYRGSLKRRTFLFELDGLQEPVLLGQEIFHSEDPGQPAGLVASCAQHGSQAVILAETKIAALETGSLHLGSVAGPVLQQPPCPISSRRRRRPMPDRQTVHLTTASCTAFISTTAWPRPICDGLRSRPRDAATDLCSLSGFADRPATASRL
ncbi:CAF17-like 4Fe-4S cluster assembly/insertion protein YgfZ [Roseateles sp. GG27B]